MKTGPSTGYLAGGGVVAMITAALAPLRERVNATTVALSLLVVVLLVAARWGSRPALAASALCVLCFNFFFLPPVGALTIADPQNWAALVAFLVTALTAGQLSARARRRAEEAEAGRREIERLYEELRAAFERASHVEALRQSEQMKSALLDAVTHDLRTPLTSIKAAATTLLSHARGDAPALDTEGQREFLEVIDEEADRLNRHVQALVELARIEAGEIRLRRRWTSVDELIAAAVERAAPLARAHRLEVAAGGELPAVRVDAEAVAEVIFTLVENATKYAPRGTRIRVTAGRGAGETVRLAVEDEGPGIAPGLRERVFDKFFRATSEGAGIGLGLAIARGVVEAHGGRIQVEDGPGGRGARIAFNLPIGDDGQPATSDDQRSAVSTQA